MLEEHVSSQGALVRALLKADTYRVVHQCRRCDLPIEKQAVSSSDGQLKGKYHRNCFNCHECHVGRAILLQSQHV